MTNNMKKATTIATWMLITGLAPMLSHAAVDRNTNIAISTTQTNQGTRAIVEVSGPSGREVELQESTDLVTWTTVDTHKFKHDLFVYTAMVNGAKRFYRAAWVD